MSSASITDQDRLLVSGFLSDKNFDFVGHERSVVLMTFGSLVMKKIAAAGLRHTVYEFEEHDTTTSGAAAPPRIRHWYSKAKHWKFFEEALLELDEALSLARGTAAPSSSAPAFQARDIVVDQTQPFYQLKLPLPPLLSSEDSWHPPVGTASQHEHSLDSRWMEGAVRLRLLAARTCRCELR